MQTRLLVHLAVMTAVVAGAPRATAAQWIRINQGAGEVGVEARVDRSLFGGQSGASGTEFREWMNVPLSGTILSSRLLSYSLNIRPTWGQQTVFGQPAGFDARSIGLGGAANILPAAPVSLSLYVDRMSGGMQGGAGSTTNSETSTNGAILRLRSSVFPISADWNTRSTNDFWQAASDQLPVYRNETLRVLRISGQSSKLTTTLERMSFADRVGTLGFSSLGGTALHYLRWGKGSSLQSMFEAISRDGREAQRRRSFSERLLLQHTSALATNYEVDQRRTVGLGNEFSTLAGSAGVRFQPRPWVTAGLRTSSSSSSFATGSIGSVAAVPSFSLNAKLPGGAQFSGSVSAGYERMSQRLPSDSWIQITDELHTVDQSRVFVLAHERGDAATLTVYSPEHTIAYLSGIDYRVTVLGDVVRIDVPIASRIAVGGTVVVSYRYAAPTVGEHDLRSADAAASLSIGGFSLTQSASLRRGRTLRGADDDRLGSGDDYVLSAGFHRPTAIGRFDLDASRRARENSRSDYTSTELRAGFAPRSIAAVQSSLGASIGRTAALSQEVRIFTSNATVNWMPTTTTRVNASMESWLWYPSGSQAEKTYIWSAELGWAVGGIEAELRYVYQRRAAAMEYTQRRLFGRFKRRF